MAIYEGEVIAFQMPCRGRRVEYFGVVALVGCSRVRILQHDGVGNEAERRFVLVGHEAVVGVVGVVGGIAGRTAGAGWLAGALQDLNALDVRLEHYRPTCGVRSPRCR